MRANLMRDTRNLPLWQSQESYIRTLKELQRRVQADEPLEFYDCTEIGNKNSECTLGLCANSIQAMQDGVCQDKGQVCPHDKRYFTSTGNPKGTDGEAWGCFYHCRVFQARNPAKVSSARRRILKVVATKDRTMTIGEPQ